MRRASGIAHALYAAWIDRLHDFVTAAQANAVHCPKRSRRAANLRLCARDVVGKCGHGRMRRLGGRLRESYEFG